MIFTVAALLFALFVGVVAFFRELHRIRVGTAYYAGKADALDEIHNLMWKTWQHEFKDKRFMAAFDAIELKLNDAVTDKQNHGKKSNCKKKKSN